MPDEITVIAMKFKVLSVFPCWGLKQLTLEIQTVLCFNKEHMNTSACNW